jgi:L-cysteine:1D-myo-inositol 2-amino-2-deoxy-alpha-D-glucopyranoside ligase
MRLYDEVGGMLREVELRPRMTIYVCGITPYVAAHMGHAFTYVHFDVLVRFLRHLGVDVVPAQNITDVDDDMLRVAAERGVPFLELAESEIRGFEHDMAALRVTPPTHSPRATGFVPEMVEEIRALVAAGHGYERDGTVYFRVASDPDYGRLSRLDRREMLQLAEERGGHPEDPAKDDPLDFVLWQRSLPGEPWWESPWGRGRPGWHIECSTMARRLLGQPVDFHGGGSDLIFPHHESEIAQAECVPGAPHPFVRHWVHTGIVGYGGDKMSKSLGNLVFARDLVASHGGLAVRSLLLRRHYREDWSFDQAALEAELAPRPSGEMDGAEAPTREAFLRALDDDLDTPRAMRIIDRAAGSTERDAQALVEEGRSILGLEP